MKRNRIDVTWTYISNRFNNRDNNELKVKMNRSRIHVTLTYISNGFNNGNSNESRTSGFHWNEWGVKMSAICMRVEMI